MDEISKIKNEITKLKNENVLLKKNIQFYKDIIDKVQVHIHINDISEKGHFDIVWANKYYYNDSAVNIIKRNNKSYYKKHYRPEDKKMMDNLGEVFKKEGKSHSVVYHYITENGDKRWHFTNCLPFKYTKNKELSQILCATVNLTDEIFNPDRYTDMIKELNSLKYELSIAKLTKTELIIIKLLSLGNNEKEIAAIQNRSVFTIKTHTKNIRKKLKLNKNTELVTFACKTGIDK